jgi:hypothetical protein
MKNYSTTKSITYEIANPNTNIPQIAKTIQQIERILLSSTPQIEKHYS